MLKKWIIVLLLLAAPAAIADRVSQYHPAASMAPNDYLFGNFPSTLSNPISGTITKANLFNNPSLTGIVTIVPGLTYGNLQNETGATLLGNSTGITGPPREITLGPGLSFSGNVLNALAGSGTVSGFTFTNGNGFTGAVTNPTTTPTLSLTLGAGAVAYSNLQSETHATLLGNPTGSAAAPSEITLGTGLSFSGSTLNAASGTGTVGSFSFTNGGGFTGAVVNATSAPALSLVLNARAVGYSQIQNVTNGRLLGNFTGAAASPSEISLGAGLSVSGSTLNTVNNGTVTSAAFTNGGGFTGTVTNPTTTPALALSLNNGAVSYAQMQNQAASTLLGNPTGSPASSQSITLGTGLSFSGTTLNAQTPCTTNCTLGGTTAVTTLNGTSGTFSGALSHTGGTLTGTTLAGTTTNSGTVSGGTVSGATISGGTISPSTVTGQAALASPHGTDAVMIADLSGTPTQKYILAKNLVAGPILNADNSWTPFRQMVVNPTPITANTTVDMNHQGIYRCMNAGDITITLPAIGTGSTQAGLGTSFVFMKQSGAGKITVAAAGANTINNQSAGFVIDPTAGNWAMFDPDSVGGNTDWIAFGVAKTAGPLADSTPPSVPLNLTATPTSPPQINLAWDVATDPTVSGQATSGMAGYKIYRGGTFLIQVATNSYQNTGLANNTSYTYTVSAVDNAGNESAQSAPASATTLALNDLTPPSVPTLSPLTVVSSNELDLSWSASTDPTVGGESTSGLKWYNVYRSVAGGAYALRSTVTGQTTFADTTLSPSTLYGFKVSAVDNAGNESAQSAAQTATTPAAPAPGNPVVFFSDLDSGPKTGGANNKGVFVTVFGKGFGATRGANTVTVGGGAADNYPLWSDTKISFQLGAAAATGNIVVNVGGGASNGIPFTVRSGAIYFVSVGGTGNGALATPMSPSAAYTQAGTDRGAGDTFYFRGGTYTGSFGGPFSDRNYVLDDAHGGTAGFPVAFVGYPGETAELVSPVTTDHENFSLGDGSTTPASYVTIADLTLTGGAACVSDGGWYATPHSGGTYERIVGNVMSARYGGSNTMTGVILIQNDHWKVLGNEMKNTGTAPAINNNHGIYNQAGASYTEIAWNYFHDLNMGHVIQVHTDPYYTYSGVSIHDNVIAKGTTGDSRGINVGNANGDSYGWIYNNIIDQVGQNFSAIAIWSGSWKIYNNTMYRNPVPGSAMIFITNAAYTSFGAPASWLPAPNCEVKNNVFYSDSASPYFDISTSAPAPTVAMDHNLYFNFGAAPPQDTAPVAGDPLFVAPASGDFHLQSGSPAKDAGTAAVNVVAPLDHDGVSRPQGAADDIGAYEFH